MYVMQDMHKKYGSIVRIDPYELHIEEESFSDTLTHLVTSVVNATSGLGTRRVVV